MKSGELKKLSYEEWRALPKHERLLLMRAAFGNTHAMERVSDLFHLPHLRRELEAHEDMSRWMPEKWTECEDEPCE